MKYIKQKQYIALKHLWQLFARALQSLWQRCHRGIEGLHMVNSCICIYLYIHIIFSFLWNYNYFTIMILYIIMDAICPQGIDGSRARVVFIQIAKCADRRARIMGHAGSKYVFCLKCSHCCVYLSVLELLQPVTPGNPLSRPHWPASVAFGLPRPGDQMTLVWPSFSSTLICNFLDSIKWSITHLDISLLDWSDMQRHLFSNLRLYSASIHVLLFVFKTQGRMFGEIW